MGDGYREFHVGVPDEPWWKFQTARVVYHVASIRGVRSLPGAERARNWAFGVTVLSREFTEINTDE